EAPASLLEAVAQEQLALARAEGYWSRQLTIAEPAEVVLAQAALGNDDSERSSEWRQHSIPLPSCNPEVATPAVWAISAVALYLARTSGQTASTLTFRGPVQERLSSALGELTSAFVPLVLTIDMNSSVTTLVRS